LGLVGPLAAVAVAVALAGRFPPGLSGVSLRSAWPAAAALLLLGFGWYAVTAIRNPRVGWYAVVGNHLLNLLRLPRVPDEDVPLTSLQFVGVAVLGAFPWTLAAGCQIGALARRRAWREPGEFAWVVLAVWVVGVVAFFSLSLFKLPQYAVPAYPAVA